MEVETTDWRSNVRRKWIRSLQFLLPIVATVVVVGILFWMLGAPPLHAFWQIIDGGLGDWMKIGNTLLLFCPLLICALGLLYTFKAGQWNIGMEGQVTAGAIAVTLVVRLGDQLPRSVLLMLMLLVAMIAGALWAAFCGLLKVKGQVSEIFSGMGLNFIASGVTIFLICGPWRQSTGATLSGTTPYPEQALLPRLSSSRFSWVGLALAIAMLALTYLVLKRTTWGVMLRSIGLSQRSLITKRLNPSRRIMEAFLVSGAMAGTAGFIQTAGVYQKLVVSIAGNIGFLAIFSVLLAGNDILKLVPICLFFSLVMKGGSRLQQLYQFDYSVGLLVQILGVFFVILASGLSNRKGD